MGAYIEFDDGAAGTARVPEQLLPMGYGLYSPKMGESLHLLQPQAWICGVPMEMLQRPPPSTLLLYFVDESAQSIGPVPFTARFPGYREVTSEWTATLLRTGVSVVRVPLQGSGPDLSELRCTIADRPPLRGNVPAGDMSDLRVTLMPVDSAARPIELGLDLDREEHVIRGLPAGTYDVRARAMYGRFVLMAPAEAPSRVVLTSGTAQVLPLSLRRAAGVSVRVVMADNSIYRGALKIRLGRIVPRPASAGIVDPDVEMLLTDAERQTAKQGATTDVGPGDLLSRRQPPYACHLLEPGEYEVRLFFPGELRCPAPRATLTSGACSEVVLRVPQ